MSLKDIAMKATQNFDASKDKPESGYESLPSGTYNVILEDVAHFVSQRTGWDGLQIKVSVLDGEYAGRTDSNMFNFDETSANGKAIPESVLSQRVQVVARLANAVGVHLDDIDWDSIDTLVTAFMTAKGKTAVMTLSVRENKKNPQYPFKNYDFEPGEPTEPMTISDEDIPF
ncbi:DUF669 domain-containing protein [Lacticaseibacillus saniviri]|uniref:DUF669 domain-containing protein n=1 Tax=Lacticaseibacillus saniviri JCM 17471 = DSM 24301 TaxID=1293598 RepID=A0A0R2MRJ0_9LACO|nr:DUF669 domain-containing protein [Lacticaseibacillus saniviri]KRO16229.1 hypothetical protein IV56_GL001684 [Lacticaseibacillus saniviri JCM 17471 = DSM 24301]